MLDEASLKLKAMGRIELTPRVKAFMLLKRSGIEKTNRSIITRELNGVNEAISGQERRKRLERRSRNQTR